MRGKCHKNSSKTGKVRTYNPVYGQYTFTCPCPPALSQSMMAHWARKKPLRRVAVQELSYPQWRRERDLNPRRCYPQWFSRPPLSATQPSLRSDVARRYCQSQETVNRQAFTKNAAPRYMALLAVLARSFLIKGDFTRNTIFSQGIMIMKKIT